MKIHQCAALPTWVGKILENNLVLQDFVLFCRILQNLSLQLFPLPSWTLLAIFTHPTIVLWRLYKMLKVANQKTSDVLM